MSCNSVGFTFVGLRRPLALKNDRSHFCTFVALLSYLWVWVDRELSVDWASGQGEIAGWSSLKLGTRAGVGLVRFRAVWSGEWAFMSFLKATLVALNATKVALRKGVLVAAVPPVPGATLWLVGHMWVTATEPRHGVPRASSRLQSSRAETRRPDQHRPTGSPPYRGALRLSPTAETTKAALLYKSALVADAKHRHS